MEDTRESQQHLAQLQKYMERILSLPTTAEETPPKTTVTETNP